MTMRVPSTLCSAIKYFAAAFDAVVHIDDSPLLVETVTVGSPVPRMPPVVDIEHGNATARPKLDAEVQLTGSGRRWPTVGRHQRAAASTAWVRHRGWTAENREHGPSDPLRSGNRSLEAQRSMPRMFCCSASSVGAPQYLALLGVQVQ